MKRKAAVLSIAFIVCALCASGITKNDNVTGDLQKDVKKCVEIMNKSGEVNNEDRKIMEEIATYYEAQGIIKEFEEEYNRQFLASIELLRNAAEQGDADAQCKLGGCREVIRSAMAFNTQSVNN